MYEVEIKAEAKEGIEEKIRKIAKKAGKEEQEDTIFSHPCRDFAKTDEVLRIRKVNKELIMTYKGPKLEGPAKSRLELETPVKPEMFRILESVGFTKFITVSKVRQIYQKGGVIFSIDNVAGLGKYIEIEKQAESEKELEKTKREVLSIFESLGYTEKDIIKKPYLVLLLEKGKH